MISCQLIAASGTAKSCYIEAENLMKDGKEAYLMGHSNHAKLIQMSAQEDFQIPLLLMHAEDQMMNCETMQQVAEQNIYLLQQNAMLTRALEKLHALS